jgi:hypothetical protein
MSEQNVEQTDGALPVQDIEGVHADPTDLPDEVQAAGDTSGDPQEVVERNASPEDPSYRQ